MKLNWRKHGIGYLAIALVITMVGFAAFNSFGAKAESGTTDTANTVVVTSPFTEAIKEVKSSVVGVSNYQMVRYSTGGASATTVAKAPPRRLRQPPVPAWLSPRIRC